MLYEIIIFIFNVQFLFLVFIKCIWLNINELVSVLDVLGNIQMFVILKKDIFKINILFFYFLVVCISLVIIEI